MKANELMIGNWVLDTRTDTPLRVNPFMAELEVPEWQPIPLTPEILKKNGFTLENKVKHPARYIYSVSYNNSVIVDFDCYNNGRGAMKCILAGVGFVSNSFIRIYGKDIYVHQLQHALKACEISKEIVV